MRLKIMMAVLWAAGLCANGCMTEQSSPEASEPEESVVGQDVSTGVRCSNKTWRVNFYSDATLTTQVGSMWCVCFQLEQLTGTTSNFTKLVNEFTCDLN
jgi:hypothetical protein